MYILFMQAGASPFTGIPFMLAMLAVFVFFIILPQRRKAKQQTTFIDGMKKGDQVVTASGILGQIDKIEDTTVTLNVGNKNYLRVTKNAISKELTDAIFPQAVDK